MKRTTYILSIFGALALSLSACSDFLDREPWDSVDTSEGFQTAEDAVAAVNAAYQPLQWAKLYNMRIWTLDIMAGNSVVGAGGGTDGIETVDLANFIALRPVSCVATSCCRMYPTWIWTRASKTVAWAKPTF